MSLRALYLTILVAACAPSTISFAAACPALSDKNVSVTGKVIEHMTKAGMLKIESKECGKITVGIQAQSKDELKFYYEECALGTLAVAEGNTIIGILEAKDLGCL